MGDGETQDGLNQAGRHWECLRTVGEFILSQAHLDSSDLVDDVVTDLGADPFLGLTHLLLDKVIRLDSGVSLVLEPDGEVGCTLLVSMDVPVLHVEE